MKFNENLTQEVKEYFDIVQFIGRYTSLKKAGATYKALCPFHNEKTPSFTVNPVRQHYHCFGCNEGGDVITFYMKIENLPFMDALKNLCKEAGIHMPSRTEHDPFLQKKTSLYKAHEEAVLLYQQQLKASPEAMQYLESRGINAATMESFQLGYASPSWDSLWHHLSRKNFSPEIMNESGLFVISVKKNSLFDRFRNRIMFPITDLSGNIVGFSGRLLPSASDQKEGKYVNSPETLIFKKSQIVFGMSQAKGHIRKQDQMILTEGHLDVCIMHQHGYANTLGTQGTAFTEYHAKILSKLSKNWMIMFDGDPAGRKATLSVWPFSMQYNINCDVAILPENEDPASILSTEKKEIFNQILKNTQSILNFKLNQLLTEYKKDSPQFIEELQAILNTVRSMPNPVAQDIKLDIISQKLQISSGAIKSMFHQNSRMAGPASSATTVSPKKNFKIPREELILLSLLIHYPEKVHEITEHVEFEWLSESPLKPELEKIIFMMTSDTWELNQYIESLGDNPLSHRIQAIKSETCEKFELALSDVARTLENNYLQNLINQLQFKLNEVTYSDPDFKMIVDKIQNLKNKRKQLNS